MTQSNSPADPRNFRVLIVDDSEPDVVSLSRMLRRQFGKRVVINEADSASAAMQMLEREPHDVALVDYRLPDMNGLELVGAINARPRGPATVLLSGQGNEKLAVQAIKRGAQDYLVKRDITAPSLEQVISQAIRSEEQDQQQQRRVEQLQRTNSELDHCVRSLSHDMSANYMVLESSLKMLKDSCDQRPLPELAEGVSHVEACLRESKRFVDDLVMLARTGNVHMEAARVELSAVAAEVIDELNPVLTERGVRVHLAPDLPAVWCNASRVCQLLSNLVRNAVKHGCDRAQPRITISPVTPAEPTPGYVWLKVHDNGPGIPAASRDEIFLPGRRLASAHPEGTGMGLAIVKRIVDHYGGRIYIDPADTRGAAFIFSLPAVREA